MAVADAVPQDQIVVVARTSSRDLHWQFEQQLSLRLDPKDLTVQVKLSPKGCWHRKAIGGKQTACGKPLGGYGSRDESYRGDLCTEGCFSRHELHELARLTDDGELPPKDP
jgi:hypothetical protein